MCSDFSCEIYLTMGQLRFFESMHSLMYLTKKAPHIMQSFWSGRQDSNLRPPGPKPGALPPAPLPGAQNQVSHLILRARKYFNYFK